MGILFLNSREILYCTNIFECVLHWIIIVLFAVVIYKEVFIRCKVILSFFILKSRLKQFLYLLILWNQRSCDNLFFIYLRMNRA